jgi:hypothetical protein
MMVKPPWKKLKINAGRSIVTAPAGLLDDAIKSVSSDFRVLRWFTVDHTLHLTWFEVEEEKDAWSWLVERATIENNEVNIYHNI